MGRLHLVMLYILYNYAYAGNNKYHAHGDRNSNVGMVGKHSRAPSTDNTGGDTLHAKGDSQGNHGSGHVVSTAGTNQTNDATASTTSSTTTRTFTNKYTDGTAAVYEEWNVIKKNKFGIKQERVFGVDFNCIYNTKRSDVKLSDRSNVRLAQRDLKDIIKFEKVDQDGKTFRITWQEDNIQYNIDYTCENERDCNQIINKLNYLRNIMRNNK